MTYSLEIINPIPGKGYARLEYLSRPEIRDEENYVELGLIVRDENGQALRDLAVSVDATDQTQNSEMDGTGNVTKVFTSGNPQIVPYYPFHYEFHTPGDHTITFTVAGQSDAITLSAIEDKRP